MDPTLAISWRGIPGTEGDKNTNKEETTNEPRETTVSLREEHKDEPDHLTCKQSIMQLLIAIENSRANLSLYSKPL